MRGELRTVNGIESVNAFCEKACRNSGKSEGKGIHWLRITRGPCSVLDQRLTVMTKAAKG